MRNDSAFTRVELAILITALSLVTIFASLSFLSGVAQRQSIQTLSNMRVVHLALQQMTLDNRTTNGPFRWTCSNNIPLAYAQWTNLLAAESYLSPTQLFDRLQLGDRERSILPLAVTENDPPETVLFVTQNWPGSDEAAQHGLTRGRYLYFRKEGNIAPSTNARTEGGQFNYRLLK